MIGVFDSGLGGLTVVKEIMRELPGYPVVYFGDTARMPYGTKGDAAVRRFAVQDAELLMREGVEVIVIACNTASALAREEVQAAVNVPVIDVVTPTVTAVLAEDYRKIGVIGTSATVRSGVYEKMIHAADPRRRLYARACPLFVPLVEEGSERRPETAIIAKRYLNQLKLRHLDALILGCTHYPFLRRQVQAAVGPGVRLIDPAQATVQLLKRRLTEDPRLARPVSGDPHHRFLVSDSSPIFARLASRWLKRPVELELVQVE
jgi:glutamate racemase